MEIVVEGIDCVGKTTLIEVLHKKTNYKHIIYDRGMISTYAYNIIHNRQAEISNTNQKDKILIYICCDNFDILQKQIKYDNHEMYDFDYHNKIFNKIINEKGKLFKNTHIIFLSNLHNNKNKTIKKLLEFLNE